MLCKAEFTDWPNPVDSVGSLQNEVHNTLSLGKSFTEYLFDFFFFFALFFLCFHHYSVDRSCYIHQASIEANILSTLIFLCTGKTTSIGVDFPLRELKVYRDTCESQAELPDSLRLFRIYIFAPVIT